MFRRNWSLLLLLLFVSFILSARIPSASKPNILFFLTDDQDLLLNSVQALPKAAKLIRDQGIEFHNTFATDPVCCPSRSSILSGKYVHNHQVINNSYEGNCAGQRWERETERLTYASYLHEAGYYTGYSGKYLNNYGLPNSGGVQHVPPGWDQWKGLVGNSIYYNYIISNNGKAEVHQADYAKDYLPMVIRNFSIDFLQNHFQSNLKRKNEEQEEQPFLLVLSFPTCHQPADPAPQYVNASVGIKAPRTPNWNITGNDKHWFVRTFGQLSQLDEEFLDLLYQRRLDTLKTVDDIIADVLGLLQTHSALDDTFVFFTSDHGYHLGQYGLAIDKRQPYDVDTRVPLWVRGPKVPVATSSDAIALNIDLMPTFLDVAGVEVPRDVDGRSLLPFLGSQEEDGNWRNDFLIEYHGEYSGQSWPCHYQGLACWVNGYISAYRPPAFEHGNFCICQDSPNNTYSCLRSVNTTHNFEYCSFVGTGEYEYYDLKSDPYQLNNTVGLLDKGQREVFEKRLGELVGCSGATCIGPASPLLRG